jgi:hypothetical protein
LNYNYFINHSIPVYIAIVIILQTNFLYGGGPISSKKWSQPCPLTTNPLQVNGQTHPVMQSPSSLLLQQNEQSIYLVHSITEQYCTTLLLVIQTNNTKESKALTINLQSLLSQLKTVFSIMNIRTSQTPEFSNIPRLMATEDLRTLYSNSAYHCTTLWHLISWPMSLLA